MPIDETNESASRGDQELLDPLASFLPEIERSTSSSASAVKTVSALDDFPSEWPSAAQEPQKATTQVPKIRRADPVQAHIDPVVSSARAVTRGRVMLLGLLCLAVLLPSLATLALLRAPRLSTVAPSAPVLDVPVVGIVGPAETKRDARLVTPSPRVPAPRDADHAFMTVAPKEPRSARDAMPSVLTSPLPRTAGPLALPSPRISGTPGALQRVPSAGSANTASGMMTVSEHKTPQVSRIPSRPTHYGSISVESQPTGAQVWIDGQLVGVTPLVGLELPARSHVVRIDLEGYDRWSASVRVVAEQTATVVARLQPTRQP